VNEDNGDGVGIGLHVWEWEQFDKDRVVGWLSGRTSVSDWRTFTGLHQTCS